MISIVSGTYNRLQHLKRMVDSVRKSVGEIPYEIIIVDGGSDDGTIGWCKYQNDINCIEQGELLGAIPAFNEGCRNANGDYVAILNDDVEVVGDTLQRAHYYLERHPEVGQVAFRNVVKGDADRHRRPIGKFYGYVYGQCCMTPRWLGDIAGWWGDEGMKTYGGDTRLSLRLVEMGYLTVPIEGCSVVDWVVDDELRKVNNEDMRGPGAGHPDTELFYRVWRDRLPPPDEFIPAAVRNVLYKAKNKRLRTLRFKGMMSPHHQPRTALINEFAKYGPTRQVNRSKIVDSKGVREYQHVVQDIVKSWRPDLVLFQAQRNNAVKPSTVRKLRRQYPDTVFVNWDGDSHPHLSEFHADIASAMHLQLVISPSYFEWYREHAPDVQIGYWPIGIEHAYIDQDRLEPTGPDIVFMANMFGEKVFPEAKTRRLAVQAIHDAGDLELDLYGTRWDKIGIESDYSGEQHKRNAAIYARSKMGLSISQLSDAWGYTSDRLYNITATGCPALVQRFAGMEEHGYVDGETCIAWSDIDEMLEKARYYLEHEDQREEIGRRGMEMTLERHTWEARMEGFWEMISSIRGLQ